MNIPYIFTDVSMISLAWIKSQFAVVLHDEVTPLISGNLRPGDRMKAAFRAEKTWSFKRVS